MRHGSEEPSLLLCWITQWRWRGGCQVGEEQRQVRKQARERSNEGVQVVCEGSRGNTGKKRPEEIQQRRVREGAVCLKTVPLQEEKALSCGSDFRLSDQARLANARYTADEAKLPLSIAHPIKQQT
jgi:hypothetical protein